MLRASLLLCVAGAALAMTPAKMAARARRQFDDGTARAGRRRQFDDDPPVNDGTLTLGEATTITVAPDETRYRSITYSGAPNTGLFLNATSPDMDVGFLLSSDESDVDAGADIEAWSFRLDDGVYLIPACLLEALESPTLFLIADNWVGDEVASMTVTLTEGSDTCVYEDVAEGTEIAAQTPGEGMMNAWTFFRGTFEFADTGRVVRLDTFDNHGLSGSSILGALNDEYVHSPRGTFDVYGFIEHDRFSDSVTVSAEAAVCEETALESCPNLSTTPLLNVDDTLELQDGLAAFSILLFQAAFPQCPGVGDLFCATTFDICDDDGFSNKPCFDTCTKLMDRVLTPACLGALNDGSEVPSSEEACEEMVEDGDFEPKDSDTCFAEYRSLNSGSSLAPLGLAIAAVALLAL